MSHSRIDMLSGGGSGSGRPRTGHRRAPRGPSPFRRLFRLLMLVLVVVAIVFAFMKVRDLLAGPADYVGQGKGKIVVEIPAGAAGQQIASVLASKDVVKSAEAFYQLSLNDDRAQSIQPGFYQLRKQMSSKAALDALVDRKNRVEGKVTVPEGARVGQIVTLITKGSDIKEEDLTAALKKPKSLGLPAVAKLNPEGYLFPATYVVEPGTSATDLLRQMVAKTVDVTKRLDINTRAGKLGLTGEEVLTVASILEYEAKKDSDYPKVARVLYNRIKAGQALQLDSTVSYVSKRKGDVFTTAAERADPSEYNTYKHTGLPPGPIGSPGEKTIEAALNPAKGDWTYFVAVNLETGETVFSDNIQDHNRAVAKLQEYCRSADDSIC
ncbi:endolytic transglycosylase MltG [Aeromicrobium sp.]|uniref:endolytic transglycosylase MltG n=1 Tax=Aeromicrobium sp. TaxID=1871063 RepID=UPI003C4581E2